jgi:hypothetical protein
MPQVGFEPMILAFEWAKRVPALDRAATVIGKLQLLTNSNIQVSLLPYTVHNTPVDPFSLHGSV